MSRQRAHLFSVSQAQVSRSFINRVCFLATPFKTTQVLWPSKGVVKKKKLPHSFKKYPNTRIIDCTEVFMEKPTSPYAQRATWSECKEHNTIKALVGINPSGYFWILQDTSVFDLNFKLGAPVIGKLQKKVNWLTCRRERSV